MGEKKKITPDMIIEQAKKFEGVKESPANSNNVIFNTHYYGHEVKGSAYPWCCAFVWDVFRMCGASKLFYDGKKTALCAAVESWGKNKHLAVSNKNKGKKGDLVLFDFTHSGRSCHIGIILKNNNDGTYTTIEGNTGIGNNSNGGMVMKRTRSVSLIRCIIRPKYDA